MPLNVKLLESSFARVNDNDAEFTDRFYTLLLADYPGDRIRVEFDRY